MKKLMRFASAFLSALIIFTASFPAYAATRTSSSAVENNERANTATALANKLQMSEARLNHLSPEMVAQLHHDFDDIDVIGIKKTYYALEKSNNIEEAKVVTVPESTFNALASGIQPNATGSKTFTGVGTLTSYILSDNSLAMSMDLLDSFHTGSSGSYDVDLTINNLRGTMVGGTTLYSR